MNLKSGRAFGTSAAALAMVFALTGTVQAQDASAGFVVGTVARCSNGDETPAVGVSVGVAGGSDHLATTAQDGAFFLALSAGQYTIVATTSEGATAVRPYV